MSGNDRKIRVLFLNHWARSLGGAEYSLIDILTEMSQKADVFLVTSEEGALCERLNKLKITVKIISCHPDIIEIKRDSLLKDILRKWIAVAAFLAFSVKLLRYVATVKPSVIHANVPKSHITLFLIMRMGYRGKGIVHMREIFCRGSVAYNIYRMLFPYSRSSVIAISEAVRNALPSAMRAKTHVIYNGVRIGDALHQKDAPPPVKFLYLGRVVPWKGCHLIVDAFKRLLTIAVPGSASLSIIGSTVYWNEDYRRLLIKNIKENGLESSVKLLEAIGDPYEAYYSHHVLCMASDYEPFGRVAAEAQSCGLPVISFATGGLPEIVMHGESGFLVPQGDLDSFTKVMTRFVFEPSMIIKMGVKGAERAKVLFNRDRQIPLIADYILNTIQYKDKS